ncbi:unnamed protein product [Parnassius apollo]|uniref:(apollo) hypothetical protein n=1 Tax=Parnassius apollo TaxID=110799 RepID=A0A8S3WQY0_PARAO|nr:unnamed protein product [Parnassius apollo]
MFMCPIMIAFPDKMPQATVFWYTVPSRSSTAASTSASNHHLRLSHNIHQRTHRRRRHSPTADSHTSTAKCLTLLQDQANTISEGLPAFGHRSIYFTCGNSILRATRTYPVRQDRQERNILVRHVPLYLIRFSPKRHVM